MQISTAMPIIPVQIGKDPEHEVVLYHSPYCPFCTKVERFLEEKGILIAKKNTQESQNRKDLIDLGGKGQVPCLIINGKALYESSDIIDWLNNNHESIKPIR